MTKLGIYMLLSCTALSGLCSYGAQTQFKTDFSGGIPPEIILIDGDQNTPATAMANIGFSVGVPWIGYYIEDEEEYVACSTSWYKPAGTSDDWMILPTIHVRADATLKWRARCSDKKYFDGYAVYVSTEGTEPESFNTVNPLFSIEEESNTWQSYEFSLAQYEGQDINIAFVNNSTNKARLYIDDIKAGTDYPILITLEVPALVADTAEGSDIIVRGNVRSELADPTELGYITLTCGEENIRIACVDLSNESTAGTHFEFSTPLHLDSKQNTVIEVCAQTENGYTYSTKQKVWSTFRPLLVEEFTGTWCSWCVRGIVYMELLKEHYGDRMIPLCVHEYDIMEVPEYFGTVDYLKEESIPNGIVNRKYEGDPSALYGFCQQALTEDIQATFTSVTASCAEESSQIEVYTSVAFSQAYKGAYSMAYVLVEDNICVELNADYCQKNAYAGGAAGAMGGFENMPSVILSNDISYRDVVRYVSDGGVHGVAGSLPGAPQPGEEYSHEYSITLPESILNKANLTLVTMIVDNRSGEVLNARSLPLADVLPGVNGINDITFDTNSGVDVYTISGIHVGHYNNTASFRNASTVSACYIFRYGDGRSQKVMVR